MSIRLQIRAVEQVAARIKLFRLVAVQGTTPAFSPGSSVSVHIPSPVNRWNTYSLAGDPADSDGYSIAVAKMPPPQSRGGSIYLHEQCKVGDILEARFPTNHFAPIRCARKHLLIAGGIGITPFLSYLPELARWGAVVELHFCHRGADGVLSPAALDPRVVFHDSAAGQRFDFAGLLREQYAGTHVYTCGTAALMAGVAEAARRLGWPESHIHEERFRAEAPPAPRPFTARLARSGARVEVAAGETLLEALERTGHSLPYSCRVGGCGTCEVAVCGGAIAHHDHCLLPEERAAGNRLMACVSRAADREVLLDL